MKKKRTETVKKHADEDLMYAAAAADAESGRRGGLMLIADADCMRAALVRLDPGKRGDAGVALVSASGLGADNIGADIDRLVRSVTPAEEDTIMK